MRSTACRSQSRGMGRLKNKSNHSTILQLSLPPQLTTTVLQAYLQKLLLSSISCPTTKHKTKTYSKTKTYVDIILKDRLVQQERWLCNHISMVQQFHIINGLSLYMYNELLLLKSLLQELFLLETSVNYRKSLHSTFIEKFFFKTIIRASLVAQDS